MISISFCTTCMGRLHHLEQTLPMNITLAEYFKLDYEICLVNWGSKDGLDDWISSNYSDMISNGKMKYLKLEKEYFEMAPAKNAAHALATKDHVCNLDADNFLDPFYIESLLDTFPNTNVVHRAKDGGDAGGRIAINRSTFIALGGYNDQFINWGYDDIDFLDRCRLYGLDKVSFPGGHVIKHSHQERMENMTIKNVKKSGRINRRIRNKNVSHNFIMRDILDRLDDLQKET